MVCFCISIITSSYSAGKISLNKGVLSEYGRTYIAHGIFSINKTIDTALVNIDSICGEGKWSIVGVSEDRSYSVGKANIEYYYDGSKVYISYVCINDKISNNTFDFIPVKLVNSI
jgi:hypothetical protein